MGNNKNVLSGLFSTRALDDVVYVQVEKPEKMAHSAGEVWFTGSQELEKAVKSNGDVRIQVVTASGEREYHGQDHANRLSPLMKKFLLVKSRETGSKDLRGSREQYLVNPAHMLSAEYDFFATEETSLKSGYNLYLKKHDEHLGGLVSLPLHLPLEEMRAIAQKTGLLEFPHIFQRHPLVYPDTRHSVFVTPTANISCSEQEVKINDRQCIQGTLLNIAVATEDEVGIAPFEVLVAGSPSEIEAQIEQARTSANPVIYNEESHFSPE